MSVTNATIGRFLAARATSGGWLGGDRDEYDKPQDDPPPGDHYGSAKQGVTVAGWKRELENRSAMLREIEEILFDVKNRPDLSLKEREELKSQEELLEFQKKTLDAAFQALKRTMDALKRTMDDLQSQTES